jgi:hypothetical protein
MDVCRKTLNIVPRLNGRGLAQMANLGHDRMSFINVFSAIQQMTRIAESLNSWSLLNW